MAAIQLDLTPPKLLLAYAHGLFPMASGRRGRIAWYAPDPRAILPLDAFNVPRGLKRALKRHRFTLTRDRDFRGVITACADPLLRKGTLGDGGGWISADIIDAYCRLHELGHAHSVEAWGSEDLLPRADGQSRIESGVAPASSAVLLGGLYGVSLGGAFFGESMFSRVSEASKICLVHLVEHLRARGYVLLDTQFHNPHLTQFGVQEIPAAEYLRRLRAAIGLDVTWQ